MTVMAIPEAASAVEGAAAATEAGSAASGAKAGSAAANTEAGSSKAGYKDKAPSKAQSNISKGLGKAKKGKSKLGSIGTGGGSSNYKAIIAGEIIIGSIIILTQATDADYEAKAHDILKQEAAFLVVFFFISAIASASKMSGRFGATLGGVICLSLLLNNPDNIFIRFAANFNAGSSTPVDAGDAGSLDSSVSSSSDVEV